MNFCSIVFFIFIFLSSLFSVILPLNRILLLIYTLVLLLPAAAAVVVTASNLLHLLNLCFYLLILPPVSVVAFVLSFYLLFIPFVWFPSTLMSVSSCLLSHFLVFSLYLYLFFFFLVLHSLLLLFLLLSTKVNLIPIIPVGEDFVIYLHKNVT